MRIVVTGKVGQVVTALQAQAARYDDIELITLGRPDIDLADLSSLEAPIKAANPDVILSVAAYTAVDKAESEPELAQTINGDAPGELARLAASLNIPILHLSTDYVFAGDKDEVYLETDPTGPVSVYGRTKLSGEDKIKAETDNYVILRTAWVYSPYGNNFVKTMLRLGASRDEVGVVSDQLGCPTYAPEIARALLAIARQVVNDPDPILRGTFNLTGQGETSWAGFAEAIFEEATDTLGRTVRVNAIPTSAYPTPAKRPANSRLSGAKLDEVYGLQLDPWGVSLKTCLDELTAVKTSEGAI